MIAFTVDIHSYQYTFLLISDCFLKQLFVKIDKCYTQLLSYIFKAELICCIHSFVTIKLSPALTRDLPPAKNVQHLRNEETLFDLSNML